MEKLLIVSDDHGDEKALIYVYQKHVKECKYLIHCGDSLNSSSFIKKYFNFAVQGNNDNNNLNILEQFSLKNLNFLILHGHYPYNFFKSFNENMYILAKKHDANVVIHGHLHVPNFIKYKDITIISPGSISQPRQKSAEKTYLILLIHDNSTLECQFINYVGVSK